MRRSNVQVNNTATISNRQVFFTTSSASANDQEAEKSNQLTQKLRLR